MSPSRFNDEPRKMWSVCSCLEYQNCKCMRSWFLFKLFIDLIMLRSEIRAAYAQSFTPWQQATIEFTCHDNFIIACSRHIYDSCCSSHTSRSWWITQSTQHHCRGCNNIPPFYNEPHRSHVVFVKSAHLARPFTSWSQHHFVAFGNPKRYMRKASHGGSKQQ